MPLTTRSRSTRLALSDVVASLMAHPHVEGIMLLGSTGTERLRAYSDYDLLVVVSDQSPSLSLGCTWIDHHFAEVIFKTISAVEGLLRLDGPMREDTEQGVLIAWLQTERLVFDRTGRLEAVCRTLGQRNLIRLNTDQETYQAWFTINYNVQQTKRYAASDDPLYRATVEVRLLYGIHEVFVHYFRVRHIPWHGDKEAVRYLLDRDPVYLHLFRQCIAESNLDHKVRLYERLAEMALAPAGPLWGEGDTSVQFRPDVEVGSDRIASALEFLNTMLATQDIS